MPHAPSRFGMPPPRKPLGDVDANTHMAETLSSQFGCLLDAVKELNSTMKSQKSAVEGVKSALDTHTKKFEILTREAEKDDQPYPEKPLNDDSTSSGLYEMALMRTKEKVERWNGRIDVTFIFVALFSAVITGFAVLVTQSISTSTSPTPPGLVLHLYRDPQCSRISFASIPSFVLGASQ
ncbi:hypothetical protein SISNIDRAFT_471302 [Sistotremastrum niveocremeum HHB9708]|uniref:DUF6535 domain-containing protein n=1 Tax=Sistotremastrum niveocremeum HHB9708 TaxID=1314777 RepID=A0A164MTL7_9AGAM|nr:hypothetical protein SISNIDRAFT_471302 [Sistotremastrum niveocremeum HHB9708]